MCDSAGDRPLHVHEPRKPPRRGAAPLCRFAVERLQVKCARPLSILGTSRLQRTQVCRSSDCRCRRYVACVRFLGPVLHRLCLHSCRLSVQCGRLLFDLSYAWLGSLARDAPICSSMAAAAPRHFAGHSNEAKVAAASLASILVTRLSRWRPRRLAILSNPYDARHLCGRCRRLVQSRMPVPR